MENKKHPKEIIKIVLIGLLTIFLILLQLSIIYFIYKSKENKWFSYFMYGVGLICIVNMFNNSLCSTYKVMWTIIIFLMPFSGSLLYLLFGNQRSFPKRRSNKVNKYLMLQKPNSGAFEKVLKDDPVLYKYANIIKNNRGLSIYNNTHTTFYNNIERKFYDMLEDMKNAKRYIFIEMFIFSNGRMLDELYEVLKGKGNEGIEIKILYDDIGSVKNYKKKFEKRFLEIPNLKIHRYEPLGVIFNPATNFRDHRKNVIIDGIIGYVGGDNIADEYANWKERFGVWRDNAFRIEGEAVYSLLSMFSETWYMSSKEMINVNKYKYEFNTILNDDYVMPYCDGPTGNANTGYEIYSSLTINANKYLYISTPYFIIDKEFIDNLILARKSNVDVRIMVPGIPDKKLVYMVTQSHYEMLLKNGVRIYEYTPGFNHAKNYICDDKYSIVGSINVDYRSLYLHFENAILVSSERVTKEMKEDYLKTLEDCKEITYEGWKNRSLIKRIIQFILKIFSLLL